MKITVPWHSAFFSYAGYYSACAHINIVGIYNYVFHHRDLSWVKIYNVGQRYEANKIEGKFLVIHCTKL